MTFINGITLLLLSSSLHLGIVVKEHASPGSTESSILNGVARWSALHSHGSSNTGAGLWQLYVRSEESVGIARQDSHVVGPTESAAISFDSDEPMAR